jgi:hypothetical protein
VQGMRIAISKEFGLSMQITFTDPYCIKVWPGFVNRK